MRCSMAKSKPCANPRARARFLAALRRGVSVALAARAAGVSFSILYRRPRACPRLPARAAPGGPPFAPGGARAGGGGEHAPLDEGAGRPARWRLGQTRRVDHE